MRVLLCALLLAGCSKAFDDYAKKSKISEAELQLNKLGKRAKAYAVERGELPKLSIPLTPEAACCTAGAGAKHKCPASPAAWAAWAPLEFEMDEPHHFQYSLESDGKTMTVKAVGDLDCDTKMIEYVMVAKLGPDGEVTTDITKPPPGSY